MRKRESLYANGKTTVKGVSDGMGLIWHYCIIEEMQDSQILGRYETYGISVSVQTEQGYREICQLHDVTTSHQLACILVERFNQLQLSPIHLREVVEDLLP